MSYQLVACSAEGNVDLREYCMQLSIDGQQGGIGQGSDGRYYFLKEIQDNQGIFVTDVVTGTTRLVASTA